MKKLFKKWFGKKSVAEKEAIKAKKAQKKALKALKHKIVKATIFVKRNADVLNLFVSILTLVILVIHSLPAEKKQEIKAKLQKVADKLKKFADLDNIIDTDGLNTDIDAGVLDTDGLLTSILTGYSPKTNQLDATEMLKKIADKLGAKYGELDLSDGDTEEYVDNFDNADNSNASEPEPFDMNKFIDELKYDETKKHWYNTKTGEIVPDEIIEEIDLDKLNADDLEKSTNDKLDDEIKKQKDKIAKNKHTSDVKKDSKDE